MDADPALNLCNQHGWSGLHYAAHEGDVEEIDRRIEAGAKVYLTDGIGGTPLMIAVTGGQLGAAEVLIAQHSPWMFSRDGRGQSVLHAAVDMGRDEMVGLILERAGDEEKGVAGSRDGREGAHGAAPDDQPGSRDREKAHCGGSGRQRDRSKTAIRR